MEECLLLLTVLELWCSKDMTSLKSLVVWGNTEFIAVRISRKV